MIRVTLAGLCSRVLVSVLALFGFLALGVPPLSANDSLSVTVTPPLFQLTIGPGESWASSLKIVNTNAYDVTYYAQVMDMQASGEEGRSKFTPLVDEAKDPALRSFALAQWIHAPSDPILVQAGTSKDLPFSVEIPLHAEPGGHYAAILVGTEPGGPHATGTVLKISSFVSTLLFVRIKGDLTESGRIREFLTSQELYQTAKADFLLRFENTGNTHVRPQGDITIYNMWGRERGKVLINQDADSSFGNVLPNSIRRFEFSWQGSSDPFDIGLYSAVVTLTYGENGKQNISSRTYFWVVPVVPVIVALAGVGLFLLALIWFIRRYIRRALALEQKKYGALPAVAQSSSSIIETLIEPVRVGVVDLRSIAKANKETKALSPEVTRLMVDEPHTTVQFIRKYALFLVFLLLLVVGGMGAWLYFHKVLTAKGKFQITDVHIKAENAPRQ